MKRSSAVKELVELLPHILVEYSDSVNYVDANDYKRLEWLAEDILLRIENHGLMVPPETRYWNKYEKGVLQYSQHNGDYLNIWEKE